LSYST
jgi:hypothetical protein